MSGIIPPSSSPQHRAQAAQRPPVRVSLVTVSDTRTFDTDKSGAFLKQAALAAGYTIVAYQIVPDDTEKLKPLLAELLASATDAIVFSGGTGIAPRDNTYDVVKAVLQKELPGFGEIFRMLSYDQVGAAAMLSRATAGICAGKFVVCLPGSTNAVQLAWDKLIGPELSHVIWELSR